ncbi:2-keto-4-pentenoate hydratase [Alloacidobacterium dinghuense]|uniref:2-keto-4-pentenoate hydratase n=2 Tax=Alloacidobacterium dinghuense TaxID=2763107 RepID=A0A7G8BRN1_9BACT|nr:2-keto-4-pentenoate hydratase [Alloacidobacterium dinghuense]
MRQASELLLAARRDSQPIESLPEALRPHMLDEAYALQDIIARALGPIGGWKVGATSPDATPAYAPMPLLGGFAHSGQTLSESYRRYRGVEAEIAFHLGKDLPVRKEAYTRKEVIDAIASAHPAIELMEPAFLNPDIVDRLSMIGDLQMNGGFVYGPALPSWQSADLTKETVVVTIDGAVRFTGTASNPAGTDLLRLVTWLANEGQHRTAGLKAGDWITTGSWCGKFNANSGSEVRVTFSTFGTVQVYFA